MQKDDPMVTYFKTKSDEGQNLIDDFFSNFGCQRTFPYEGFQVKKYEGTGLISEKKGSFVCRT